MSPRPALAAAFVSLAERAALDPAWRGLAASRGNAFLSPEWHDSAVAVYPDQTSLPVAVRTAEGALVGVASLVRCGEGPRGTLRFAGFNLGDRFGLACAPEDEVAVAEALGALLAERGERRLILDNCPAGADWLAALERTLGRGSSVVDRSAELPEIDLSPGWGGYLASRSRNFRSQVGRKARGLERDHEVELSLCEDADGVPAAMERFFELHEARWDERGGSGSLTAASRRFHLDFARRAFEQGWLRLWLMHVDGEPAAALYGWSLGGTFSYYLAGLDPGRPKLSAGFVLLAKTIEAAAAEGDRTYDLLLGDEEYKGRFATGVAEVSTTILGPALSPAILSARLERGARNTARRMSDENRDRARRAFRRVAPLLPGARKR